MCGPRCAVCKADLPVTLILSCKRVCLTAFLPLVAKYPEQWAFMYFDSIFHPFGFHLPFHENSFLQDHYQLLNPPDSAMPSSFLTFRFYAVDKFISLKLFPSLIFKTSFSLVLLFPLQLLLLHFFYGHPSPACPLNPHVTLRSVLGPGCIVSFSDHTDTAASPICLSNWDLYPVHQQIYLGVS